MVLCAGFGTRLRPLTEELPKPLVPIGDAALLDHIVRQLRAAGLERIVVNAHHLPDAVGAAGKRLDLDVVRETAILGTAGGVHHAGEAVGVGALVVVNGDILAELDVTTLMAEHAAQDRFATLAVADRRASGQGTVGLAADGTVVRLRGEVFGTEVAGADFVGAQVLSADARRHLPQEGCLVGDLYLPALRRGVRLAGAAVVGRFWDIGTPSAYLACNLAWLADAGAASWPMNTVHPDILLTQCILGDATELAGEGTLCEVVAWPGARVVAPLERAIVTREHVVRIGNL